MPAHYFQLSERNNFYLKQFSLNPIFIPLEGGHYPKMGQIDVKINKSPSVHKKPQNMYQKYLAIRICLSGPNLSQLNQIGILTPIFNPQWVKISHHRCPPLLPSKPVDLGLCQGSGFIRGHSLNPTGSNSKKYSRNMQIFKGFQAEYVIFMAQLVVDSC